MTISTESKNYKKILNLEKAFASIDLISNFYILKFNNKFTQYRIIYNGSPKTFLNDMVNRNFDLTMEKNVWTVK